MILYPTSIKHSRKRSFQFQTIPEREKVELLPNSFFEASTTLLTKPNKKKKKKMQASFSHEPKQKF